MIAVWWYHWGYERGKNDECRRWNSLLEGLGFHITSPKKVPLQNEDDKSVQAQDAYWFQK